MTKRLEEIKKGLTAFEGSTGYFLQDYVSKNDIEHLISRLESAAEVIEFYATVENYGYDWVERNSFIAVFDGGKKARRWRDEENEETKK